MNNNWQKKLTSRKFWIAVSSFVGMLMVTLGSSEDQAVQITALIMAGASVIAYIVGEGMIDAVASSYAEDDSADENDLYDA